MNKKPIDTLLDYHNFNETLFKQSVSLVHSAKNITPLAQLPIDIIKQSSLDLKKKQQTIQTHLAKTIKLFGQVMGVSKNTYGTVTDYAIEIFDQLTDLIETSCQSYIDKKKNIKSIEKEKQRNLQTIVQNQANLPQRPQIKYHHIKPAYFDRHWHQMPCSQKIVLKCDKVQTSQPISEPFIYINTIEGLEKAIMQLKQCKEIAVDLQHSNKSYQGLTCLIQISSRYKDYIIDVFPIWQYIPLLKDIIQDQNILKIMHGAEMDTKWFQRDFNIHIRNLFDTYKASRVLGYPKFSYAYLLHHYCSVVIDKKYQLADWTQRPLTQDMLNYARMDTHFLLQIWDKLLQDLTQQARSMNLDPQATVSAIYQSSHQVTLSQVELFSYKKKQLYQNLKNDTKPEDFSIIQTIFWTIDKVAKDQDEAFDDLIGKKTLIDVIARVKDLLQNRKATIDMLRVKIDRLVAVIKSHKYEKVVLLLAPIKRELQKFFLDPKRQIQTATKKKGKIPANQTPLIEILEGEKKKQITKQGILISQQAQQGYINQKPSITIEQLDYPLKTYENFSLQQRLNNKKSAFCMIEFQPIMSFLSKKFKIQQKRQDQNDINDIENEQKQIEIEMQMQNDLQQEQINNEKQNEGFLQFKRIKPNVIYTIEEEEQQKKQQKPRKKRKELEYQEKLKSKEGNIYELLSDV